MSDLTSKECWAHYAVTLKPALRSHAMHPVRQVTPISDDSAFQGWRMEPSEGAQGALYTGDSRCWDFGGHHVGTLSFRVTLADARQDAPVKLRISFGEMPCEVAEPASQYKGWISAAWLQEEITIVDQLPCELTLPRRYAFRYVLIEVLAASTRFAVEINSLLCHAVTSAGEPAPPPETLPPEYRDLWRVSLCTLRDCMQLVFEDGPKRDRRLWLGDLRLQALTNYASFRQNDLVKRCLCMFAAAALPDGRLPAAVYDTDPPLDDENCLADYALLFVAALEDYCKNTGDMDFTREIYPVAVHQLAMARQALDQNGLMTFDEGFTCFIDWNQELDKHAALQGVYLYCLQNGISLAQRISLQEDAARFERWLSEGRAAALAHCWDGRAKRFRSGDSGQISWASQIWMALSGVLESPQAAVMMQDVLKNPPTVAIVTPYLMHYLVEALFSLKLREEGMIILREYWGGMIALGADTFWEIYLPENPTASPYGGNMIHSYCHAWSCTPAYFLRQSFL